MAVVLVVATLLGCPVLAMPATGDDVSLAGLVVVHGDGSMTWAVVAFDGAEISGTDLLARSGIDYLSVPFGALGEGVCQIEREGCEVTECRRTVCQTGRTAPYWQYLEQSVAGVWRPAPLGASGSRVADGEVLAWAWAAEPPELPAVDVADVAARAGLDPAGLATLGLAGHPASALRSGFAAPVARPSDGLRSLLWGGLALAALVVVGAGLLVSRRRVAGRPGP